MGQAVQEECLFDPLKMGPICCLETSVSNYQPKLSNMREEQKSQESKNWILFLHRPAYDDARRGRRKRGGGRRGGGGGKELEKFKSF